MKAFEKEEKWLKRQKEKKSQPRRRIEQSPFKTLRTSWSRKNNQTTSTVNTPRHRKRAFISYIEKMLRLFPVK